MSDNEIGKVVSWARELGHDDAYARDPRRNFDEFTSNLMYRFGYHDVCLVGQLADDTYRDYETAYREVVVASQM